MIGAYTNKCIFKFSLIKPPKNAKIHTCNHANASSENTFPPQHLSHSLELAWVSDLKIDQNTTTTTNTEPTKRRYADAYDFSTKYNHTLAAFSRPQVIARRAAHRAKSFFFCRKIAHKRKSHRDARAFHSPITNSLSALHEANIIFIAKKKVLRRSSLFLF